MSLLNSKYLFVHINKSGGGIFTTNMNNPQNGMATLWGVHRSLEDMLNRTYIPPENLYIFTTIRNPWDRMLSMYLYYYKNFNVSKEFFSGDPTIDNSFTNWIKYIYSDKFDRNSIHSGVNMFKYCFSNQLNWIKNKNGELMKVDKILRFENLKTELKSFLTDVLQLNHVNTSMIHPTNHTHYSDYYDDESKKLIEMHYKDDIEYFNYSF